MSGLLIATLLLNERRSAGSINLKSFYRRRAFRILPPFLAYLGVIAALGLTASGWEFAGGLLFFRNYLPAREGGIFTAHLWSLAVEEHFYLIWPALPLSLAGKWKPVAILAAGCALWRTLEARLHLLPEIARGQRSDLRFDALLWGAVAAFLLYEPGTRDWLRRRVVLPVWLMALATCAYCVVKSPPMAPTWTAILMPLLLAGTILHPEWTVSGVLDTPLLAWIGRISYSLYLWQQLFLVPAWEKAIFPWGIGENVAAVLVCASASYYLIEKPMIRLGRRWPTSRLKILASDRLSLPDRRFRLLRRS